MPRAALLSLVTAAPRGYHDTSRLQGSVELCSGNLCDLPPPETAWIGTPNTAVTAWSSPVLTGHSHRAATSRPPCAAGSGCAWREGTRLLLPGVVSTRCGTARRTRGHPGGPA